MADEGREEDDWLYGENVTDDQIKLDPEIANKLIQDDEEATTGVNSGDVEITKTEVMDTSMVEGGEDGSAVTDQFIIAGNEPEDGQTLTQNGSADEEDEDNDDDDDDDSDDDGVQVVIGDLKSGAPASGTFASKRTGPPPDKKGKFSVEDFEAPGAINGVSAVEYSLDILEEKPWRKPGADITDYFNYGFTEDTWRAYCDRQKRIRFETGAILTNPMAKQQMQGSHGGVQLVSDGSKYGPQSNILFPKSSVQPQFPRKDGSRRDSSSMQLKQDPKENTIQVRVVNTVDRRDNFGRKGYDGPPTMVPPPFDMTVPPPVFRHPEYMGPPPTEFFNRPPPGYYQEEDMPGYEEQQWMDSQWEMEGSGIGASSSVSVVPLSKAPLIPPPPGEATDEEESKSRSKDDRK